MAVRTDFVAGEVLAAQDLDDTFASKANLASPTFTGTPAAPTAAAGTNTTQIATTAFVQAVSGLAHINTTTFSAVSSVSINNVFTSQYNNYRIFINLTNATNDETLTIRLRAATVDSTVNYNSRRIDFGSVVAPSSINTARFELGFAKASVNCPYVIDLSNPALAESTGIVGTGSATSIGFMTAGNHTVSTSYDGFTYFIASGTMTGTIRVYGYKNS